MVALTVWFDRFDTEEETLEILNDVIEKKFSKIGLVGVNYTQKIGKLIIENQERLSSFNFENLRVGRKIRVDNEELEIIFVPQGVASYVRTEKGLLNLGDFELVEE